MEVRMGVLGGEIEILASPFSVKPVFRSDRLQQSGFSRPFLADEKGDGGMKLQAVEMPHCRNAKGIFIAIDDRFLFQADSLQKRLLNNRRPSLAPVIGSHNRVSSPGTLFRMGKAQNPGALPHRAIACP